VRLPENERARPHGRLHHRVPVLVGAREAEKEPDPDDALGLTPRERTVLELVARGYTNREIAEELTISVKTASVHVLHILRKLDVSTRLQAAAIAQRLSPLR
jgi:DNA-binding NarL/FixJ family response regulator